MAQATWLSTHAAEPAAPSHTFVGVSIGAAVATRYIAVACTVRNIDSPGTVSIDSVTIGGIAATIVVDHAFPSTNKPTLAFIAIAPVPTGTTANIAFSFTGNCQRIGMDVYYCDNPSGVTPAATGFDDGTLIPADNTLSYAPDVPADGFVLSCAISARGDSTFTWTGITERSDEIVGGNDNHSTASENFATAQSKLSITAASSNDSRLCGVLAVWAPEPTPSGGLAAIARRGLRGLRHVRNGMRAVFRRRR